MPAESTILNPQELRNTPEGPNVSFNEQEDSWMGILSRRPPWIVRWGITLLLVIIGLLLCTTWLIHYPDRVSARGKLLAQYPPQQLQAKMDGRLLHLLVAEGDNLQTGELIAVLQSTANYLEVLTQKVLADSLLQLAKTNQSHELSALYNLQVVNRVPMQLGELQNDYQQFFGAIQTFTLYLGNGYYLRQRQMLQNDLSNITAQQQVISEQLELTRQEVNLAGENFKVSETLSKQKVIAPVEYRNEAGKWLSKQLQVPQLKNIQLSNTAQQLEKLKQIEALENEIAQQKGIFIQALQNWQSKIAAWEQQYLLYAPCNGKLVLTSFYNPGRNLQKGEVLGSVYPDSAGYYLEVNLPQYNFGKLRVKQNALIRLDAYPTEEFGTVTGLLEEIKLIPNDSGYLAKLVLPQGLTTHLGKPLRYQEGLQATVEIVTDNRRLIDRLISGVRKAIQR